MGTIEAYQRVSGWSFHVRRLFMPAPHSAMILEPYPLTYWAAYGHYLVKLDWHYPVRERKSE